VETPAQGCQAAAAEINAVIAKNVAKYPHLRVQFERAQQERRARRALPKEAA